MDNTFLKFVVFVPVVLAVYYLLPRRWRNRWLLLASYAFYATWTWQFPVILFVLTGVSFAIARALQPREGRGRRFLLWIGIGANVLALAFFKYAGALFPAWPGAHVSGPLTYLLPLGWHPQTGTWQILLPVGLSFAVLQTISYLVDVYRGQTEAASDAVDFALYLAYFPKLISGPIERARSFLPRLAGARQVDGRALTRSLTLILVGMARKLLIADPLRIMTPQDVFTTPAAYAPSLLATWLLAYAFSLYNDFAGYTGLVRGISGLFGIELSPNFRQPYLARSFTEFWNRWHITLSHWLRDYIYYPLSRALLRRNPGRRSVLNLALPPLVTMLMSGLWHGASWHMLLWGGLHGVYQVVERIPSLWRPVVPSQKQPRWRQVIAAVIVFVLAVLAWLPFSMSLPAAAAFLRGLFTWTRWEAPDVRVFALIVPSVLLDWAQYHSGDEVVFLRWPRPARALALTFVVLAVVLLATQTAITAPPFVYQGF